VCFCGKQQQFGRDQGRRYAVVVELQLVRRAGETCRLECTRDGRRHCQSTAQAVRSQVPREVATAASYVSSSSGLDRRRPAVLATLGSTRQLWRGRRGAVVFLAAGHAMCTGRESNHPAASLAVWRHLAQTTANRSTDNCRQCYFNIIIFYS